MDGQVGVEEWGVAPCLQVPAGAGAALCALHLASSTCVPSSRAPPSCAPPSPRCNIARPAPLITLPGDLPNVYVYACNNPSESIIAKRRGYGTIVSYNVPPYGRAGLYKQMAELKALLAGGFGTD